MAATGATTSSAYLETLFEEAPFGLALFTPDLRYRRVNERLAAINGIPAEEHVGRSLEDIVPDLASEVADTIRRTISRREPISVTVDGETPASPGVPRRYGVSYHPVEEDGELVGVMAVVLEVSPSELPEGEIGRLIELERGMRTRAEAAEQRAAFIAEATSLLDASLDLRTTLRTFSRIVVPRLADLCLVDMLDDDATSLRRLAVAHADPAVEDEVWELSRRWPSLPQTGRPGIYAAVESGDTLFLPELTERTIVTAFPHPEHLERVRALALRSVIVVPLRARGRTLGAITFVQGPSGRIFTSADVALAEELTRRAALAVDNARLYTDLRRADRAQRFLAEATQLLSASLDWETTLETVARLATAGIADLCEVDILEPTGELRPVAMSHVDPEKLALLSEVRRTYPSHHDSSRYHTRAQQSGEAVLEEEIGEAHYRELAQDEQHLELLRQIGMRSGIFVPMEARGRTLGTISFGVTESDRRFGEEDLRLAQELARRAAVAADNARLYSDRSRVARTLQRSLMPTQLPQIPGVESAVHFRSAGDGGEVGGDFYDVFHVRDGAWAAVVGDVCGKGAQAAALTALSRHTMRAAAGYESGPVGVLRALNQAICEQSPELLFTTAALLWIEPREGRVGVRAAVAGHLPPLVVRAGGTVEEFSAGGALLGVFDEVGLSEAVTDLAPGDAIVLYTDGVTEAGAPEAPLGEARLRDLVGACAGRRAAEIVRAVERRVNEIEPDAPRDDVAVLVLRYSG